MAPARKVFTEAMVRRILKAHFEVEPANPINTSTECECHWTGTAFEDHFIDQLHKLWHEMFNRRPTSITNDTSDPSGPQPAGVTAGIGI
jgi:hypothetical protein